MPPFLSSRLVPYLVALACTAGPAIAGVSAQSLVDLLRGQPHADPSLDGTGVRVARSVVQVVATLAPAGGVTDARQLVRAFGSGVVVDDGYVVTSAEGVVGAVRVEVLLPSADPRSGEAANRNPEAHAGEQPGAGPGVVEAEIVGVDEALDLAVLRIPSLAVRPLRFATAAVRSGDVAMVLGALDRDARGIAAGMVLAGGAPIREGSSVPYLVIEGTAAPTGSVVVNGQGDMVGVTVGFAQDGTRGTPVTVALPAALVQAAYARIRAGDTFRAGMVGLAADSQLLPSPAGPDAFPRLRLVVSRVAPGLPADRAGIREGDVIVAVDDEPVDAIDFTAFFRSLYTLRAGAAMAISVERDGRRLEFAPVAVAPPTELLR